MSHEPQTIDNLLIIELFDYLLQVLGFFLIQEFGFPPLHQPPPRGTRVLGVFSDFVSIFGY